MRNQLCMYVRNIKYDKSELHNQNVNNSLTDHVININKYDKKIMIDF